MSLHFLLRIYLLFKWFGNVDPGNSWLLYRIARHHFTNQMYNFRWVCFDFSHNSKLVLLQENGFNVIMNVDYISILLFEIGFELILLNCNIFRLMLHILITSLCSYVLKLNCIAAGTFFLGNSVKYIFEWNFIKIYPQWIMISVFGSNECETIREYHRIVWGRFH